MTLSTHVVLIASNADANTSTMGTFDVALDFYTYTELVYLVLFKTFLKIKRKVMQHNQKHPEIVRYKKISY